MTYLYIEIKKHSNMQNLNYMVVISANFPFGRTLTRGHFKTLECAQDYISNFLSSNAHNI